MNNDVVVITGGFGHIGQAVARAAKAQGARVALIDMAPEAPASLAADLGGDALYLGGVDLTDPAAAAAAFQAVQGRFGAVHVLLNVAGGFRWQTLEDGDLGVWDLLYRINTVTAVTACKAALPHLVASGAGRIVNVGAYAALKAAGGMGPYTASKAAVIKLTESLAEELKGKVTVNAVLPATIDTPVNRADMPDVDPASWVSPDEVASAMLLLASREAKAITGALAPLVGN